MPIEPNNCSTTKIAVSDWARQLSMRADPRKPEVLNSPIFEDSHSSGTTKPVTEFHSVPVAEKCIVIQLPESFAMQSVHAMQALALGAGGGGLARLRELHTLCRIDVEFSSPEHVGRGVPVVCIRPSLSVDPGPVASSIAMTKAARDVNKLVQSLRAKFAESTPPTQIGKKNVETGHSARRMGLRPPKVGAGPVGEASYAKVEGNWCDMYGPVSRIESGMLTLLHGGCSVPFAVLPPPARWVNVCFGIEAKVCGERWVGWVMRNDIIQWTSGHVWSRQWRDSLSTMPPSAVGMTWPR